MCAESGEGYQARRTSAVPFPTLIILIISQQRVGVEDGWCGGLSLISRGEMMSAAAEKEKKKNLSLLVNLREHLDRGN